MNAHSHTYDLVHIIHMYVRVSGVHKGGRGKTEETFFKCF